MQSVLHGNDGVSMIEETAIVTRVHNDKVWIKSRQDGACGGCIQQTSCGTATLSTLLPKREFAVDCVLKLQIGDQVKVAIDDTHLLFSSFLLYLLPLLAMLCGVGLANALLPAAVAEIWLPEIAFLFLLLAFNVLHRLQPLILLHICFKPQILGKF